MCSPPPPQIKSLDTLIEQSVKYSNRTVTTQNAMPVLCGQQIIKLKRYKGMLQGLLQITTMMQLLLPCWKLGLTFL